MELGAGDDVADIKVNGFFDVSLFVLLNQGSDNLVVETLGCREIRTLIDMGPAGDGRDRVSVSHQSLRRSGRVNRLHLDLDGGMDVYERSAVGGYTIETSVSEGVVTVEYLVLGT